MLSFPASLNGKGLVLEPIKYFEYFIPYFECRCLKCSHYNNSFVLVFLAVLTQGVAAFSQVKDEDEATVSRRPGKKLTEAEEWEARQLRSSGVLDPSEYPTFSDGEVRSI